MTVGAVSTRILTDIANAIRFQAGVATLYKPREMASAVAALDGTNAGNYQAQPYMALESGVLSDSVFADIADAIRGQNGFSTLYAPGDMAQAILDLVWDVRLKPRAVLTSLGTLEFNYVDGRHCYSGGVPVDAWEIDPAGYSSASARPYDSVKLQVRKVVFHSSWAQVGMTNASYATAFSNFGLSASFMFNGCNRLVGGTDGFVPSSTSGASVCKIGVGGVLTDPNADGRHWFYAHHYDDGEGVLTATATPEAGRGLRASGRICAEAKYVGLGFTPWDGVTGATRRQHLTSATFAADMVGYSSLNFQRLFYSCTSLASVSGMGNLSGVRSMRFMFSSCAVTTLDFRGFDPSALTDLYYAFSSCSSLATIYADPTWALPTSGISGSQCFYSCSTNLVGGNGTVWASSKTAYTYFRIDTASTPGYITAA